MYYLKKTAIIYVFLLMTAITSVAIITITQNTPKLVTTGKNIVDKMKGLAIK